MYYVYSMIWYVAVCVCKSVTYRPIGFVGVRICDIFSRKSSLNERARLASLMPRKLFLCKPIPTSQFPLCANGLFSAKIQNRIRWIGYLWVCFAIGDRYNHHEISRDSVCQYGTEYLYYYSLRMHRETERERDKCKRHTTDTLSLSNRGDRNRWQYKLECLLAINAFKTHNNNDRQELE